MSHQEQVNREVVASVTEFLGGPTLDGAGWAFEFGEHLESNWGAVYAGALAAGMLSVARCTAPEHSPRALHLQLVRSVPRGVGYATAEVRHAGRTVATVEVDLYDARRKLAAVALVTMVTPSAVATDYHDTTATPFQLRTTPFELEIRAPVQKSLHMLREDDGVYFRAHGENVRPNVDGTMSPIGTITVPWDSLECTGPEVACLAADPMVGSAVLGTFVPTEVVGPNPDLSLRFTTAPATRVVQTSGTMLSVQHGTATIALEVQAGTQQLAQGLGTCLLLPPK
jgi:hypothetical protein